MLGLSVSLGVRPPALHAQTFQGVEYLSGVKGLGGPLRGRVVVTPDTVHFQADDGQTTFALERRIVVEVATRDSASFGQLLSLRVQQGDTLGNVLFRADGSVASDVGDALRLAPHTATAPVATLPHHARVRVTVRFQVYEGTYLGQDAQSLRIEVPGVSGAAEVVSLPTTEVLHLEVSRPGPSAPAQGAVIGLASGAAAGVLVGAITYLAKGLSCLHRTGCNTDSHVGLAALVGAGVGGVVGLVIGATTHPEDWEEIRWHASGARMLAPPDGRLAWGVALRF